MIRRVKRSFKGLLLLAVALAFLDAELPDKNSAASSSNTSQLTVTKVIDGDTIELSNGKKVRLIGVDTPETKHPKKGVECYGPEASKFTTSLLPAGTAVKVESDKEPTDRYGRDLAYVYRSDGLFVNAELLKQGYGRALAIKPNVAHASEFAALATQADKQDKGLWGHC